MMAYHDSLVENKNFLHFEHRDVFAHPHFHSAVELIFVEQGELTVTVDGHKKYCTDTTVALLRNSVFTLITILITAIYATYCYARKNLQTVYSNFLIKKIPRRFLDFTISPC